MEQATYEKDWGRCTHLPSFSFDRGRRDLQRDDLGFCSLVANPAGTTDNVDTLVQDLERHRG